MSTGQHLHPLRECGVAGDLAVVVEIGVSDHPIPTSAIIENRHELGA
jgi:hypothetical protein